MAANFRISAHRKSDGLHLKLMGDFDGTSACELLNALREKPKRTERVIIHTCGLREICRFGKDTFQKNLHTLKGRLIRLVFTGKSSADIAPEENKLSSIFSPAGGS